jgi:hypothetical protein
MLTADFQERLVPESETDWHQLCAQIEARQETPLARTLRPRWTLPVWSGAALAAVAVVLLFLRSRPPSEQVPSGDIGTAPGVAQVTPPKTTDNGADSDAQNTTTKPKTGSVVAAKSHNALPATPSQVEPGSNEKKPSLPDTILTGGPKKQRPVERIARHNSEPRPIVPEKTPTPRTHPRLAKRDLGVDGERASGSDLSQQYVAYMVPQNENRPPRRSFVMDQIPVTASATTPVSYQPQTQELQAW